MNLHRLTDDELLDLRLKDLPVAIQDTWLEDCIDQLHEELAAKGLARFQPHVWLSSEWFSPDDVPGIAVPFYLADPRLIELEKKQMLKVEGGTLNECMRLLRHEAGHAIDTAYGLRRRKAFRTSFGSFAEPYPDTYQPKPDSRDYVLHLAWWYAQAHPAEDFAETFAVWLTPRHNWREQYAGWPALDKLEAMDAMMSSVADAPPKNKARRKVEPLSTLSITLREHYRQKRMRYLDDWPDFIDRDLRRLFTDDPKDKHRQAAAPFLRRIRVEVRDHVARWTGTHPYTIDQVLTDMIDRCRELKLRLRQPEMHARTDVMVYVAVQTMNYLHRGTQPVAV